MRLIPPMNAFRFLLPLIAALWTVTRVHAGNEPVRRE